MTDQSPLSVVIPTRHSWPEVFRPLEPFVEQMGALGGEVIVASQQGSDGAPASVQWVTVPGANILELRAAGIRRASGTIVAVGEDHAIPRASWSEAVLRAHAEHPEAAAVVGCMHNATAMRVVDRAGFRAYATPWTYPMPELRAQRPPPVSACSFKRDAFTGRDLLPGMLEAQLLSSFFLEGRMVGDDRIIVDHYQTHGIGWSLRNAFFGTRASYGYARDLAHAKPDYQLARWVLVNVPTRLWREVDRSAPTGARETLELLLVSLIAASAGLGGAAGSLFGPGRGWEHAE